MENQVINDQKFVVQRKNVDWRIDWNQLFDRN